MKKLKRLVKSAVERSLGVTISRQRPVANVKPDPAIAALRKWSGSDVVFDVGANDGRTVLRIAEPLNFPRIYAFEPVASTYSKLVERTSHLKNVKCFQIGMGQAPGRQTIYLNDIDAMNSFLPTWTTTPQTAKTETVTVSTVDQVMAEQNVDFVHLLKIDTEGYEMEVLRGAQRALADSRIAMVVAEVGFGQSSNDYATLEQVRSHLAPLGYRLYGVFTQARAGARAPQHWPAQEVAHYKAAVLAYCDALFVRADI